MHKSSTSRDLSDHLLRLLKIHSLIQTRMQEPQVAQPVGDLVCFPPSGEVLEVS